MFLGIIQRPEKFQYSWLNRSRECEFYQVFFLFFYNVFLRSNVNQTLGHSKIKSQIIPNKFLPYLTQYTDLNLISVGQLERE